MQVKVFTAPKVHKALALVRQEFGPDAVIMDRLEGVDSEGNRVWHVHAALDFSDESAEEASSSNYPPNDPPNASQNYSQKHSQRHSQKASHVPAKDRPQSSDQNALKSSMERLERIVEGLGRQESDSLREALSEPESRDAFDHLTGLGVAPMHAFDMAEEFAQHQPISTATLQWSERIQPQKQAAKVLFLGPSGAGKSTLIAKLATHYSLKGVRVAVVSTDANRMSGVDMLKSYTEILGVPFFTARSEEDVDTVLEATKSAQLLLIDSEGWNVRRAGGVRRQQKLWAMIPTTHRVVVMPANMDEVDGMEILAKAGEFDVNQLAFSKLDETSRPGKIVNWAAAFGMRLSYCSFGPEIPEQMGWLTPQALTALLSSQEIRYARESA